MGSKRSHDGLEPLQLPYKFSKQLATDEKLISFTNEKLPPVATILPCTVFKDKFNIPGNYLVLPVSAYGGWLRLSDYFVHNKSLLIDSAVGHNDPRLVEPFEINSVHGVRNVIDKGHMGVHGFPCITDSPCDEYGWCSNFQRQLFPCNFGSNTHGREPIYVDSELSSFLDRYPRKQVPIGANFQADLPKRESPKAGGTSGGASNSIQVLLIDEEKQFMGTCIMPTPDSSLPAHNILPTGAGRKECDCADRASVRCVRQHVKEARNKLMKALGEEKFCELGFLDMGEEVAHEWSEEEEKVFHEIVFSNPASLGKDFWSCLSEEFPTRSIRDIVSYYFNVFMLRKRAAQNRSRFLDIDSDDDEWNPGHGRSCGIGFASEDGDSVFDNHEDDNGDSDDDNGYVYADKDESSQPNLRFLHKESDFFPLNHDDSCISFEYESGSKNSTPTGTGMPDKELSGLKKDEKYFASNHIESGDGLIISSPGCLGYSNDFRSWDQGFSSGLDHLLPTENILEEIFGPGSWEIKSDQD